MCMMSAACLEWRIPWDFHLSEIWRPRRRTHYSNNKKHDHHAGRRERAPFQAWAARCSSPKIQYWNLKNDYGRIHIKREQKQACQDCHGNTDPHCTITTNSTSIIIEVKIRDYAPNRKVWFRWRVLTASTRFMASTAPRNLYICWWESPTNIFGAFW